MQAPVLLITPPFTQLNTPYPATAYLKGFLNTKGIPAHQCDLGIEVTLAIFCKQGLEQLFAEIGRQGGSLSENAGRIVALQADYCDTIDEVLAFLQGTRPTLAHRIAGRGFLPEAGRFAQLDDLQWAFGAMGTQDRAKHIATLYLEDLSDLIQETVDEHFGFSRYAERLGRSANSFDELQAELRKPLSYVDRILVEILEEKMRRLQPRLVALSVPFPGNLYTSLRCGQWIKAHYPSVPVAMGGGFANTELRSLSDPRVFDFYDYITLDDGEAPIEQLIAHIEGHVGREGLKRTFTRENGAVVYYNNTACSDYRQGQVGTPDYSDFFLDKYISAIEVVNPMHSLWSDGRWNKLTMAHGCYWGKCTFCDISLDYIKNYEPLTAVVLVDRMEELIAQTGQNGFHFVDEAAPPALMRALAIEILRRRLVVSWWANVRFEKAFSRDLCLLLKASGCIAVSGGLEVASDRLLALIRKGITVAQVARVCRNLSEAGIMVHAYLMYGFPTQTEQETIDSLELVRQLFESGVLQSAFWHLFTMTAHSPIGLEPDKFQVRKVKELVGTFANNDIDHIDPKGAAHEQFGFGLKKALFNYMHAACLDYPLQKWFDFKVPKPTVAPDTIRQAINEPELLTSAPNSKVLWIGKIPAAELQTRSKKGAQWEVLALSFPTQKSTLNIQVDPAKGAWLQSLLPRINVHSPKPWTLQQVQDDYEKAGLEDFELFWDNKPVNGLFKAGLLRM
ncbi:MAG: radical SAM protein [Chitinophagaceae bacterium]|nr:MAG: radical SAM protein [Chitinophagaceae bacterium]